jgi:hypothetical protein
MLLPLAIVVLISLAVVGVASILVGIFSED